MIIRKGMKGELVRAWQAFLAEKGYGNTLGLVDGRFGLKTENATIRFQDDNLLESDGIVGFDTLERAKEEGFEVPKIENIFEISLHQFSYIMHDTRSYVLEKHLPYCNEAIQKYEINNSLRIQHFLAQVGYESAGLRYMSEIASGQAYEGRRDLGNVYPGDGKKFKGHGPIQITGRKNHTDYFNFIGRPDLIVEPDILETDLELCWGASGWFWKSRGLNDIADTDDGTRSLLRMQNKTLCRITKIVNGGYNGLRDRAVYLERAKVVLE